MLKLQRKAQDEDVRLDFTNILITRETEVNTTPQAECTKSQERERKDASWSLVGDQTQGSSELPPRASMASTLVGPCSHGSSVFSVADGGSTGKA